MSIIAFKFRVKDATSGKRLNRYAIACNQVWNYCVSVQREAERRWKAGANRAASRWPTAFDLIKLCTGAAADLGLHSDTVNTICRQFAVSRDAKRGAPRFRASFGAKRALGWVPFIPRAVRIDGDAAIYLKRRYRFWKHREIVGEFKSGAFVQDARGRWHVCFQCDVPDDLPCGDGEVGIDLGLATLATLSDGRKIPAMRHYRKHEIALAKAQRAGRRNLARKINAKIAAARRHHLHEQSARISRENKLIVVGDASASKLGKTKMAKSIYDAGWAAFKHMLRYKAARRRAVYVEADERWSSQLCSTCGCLPASRPKGIAQLGVRSWTCSDCGTDHDRDTNAALNILASGRSVALQLTESRLL